VSERKEAGEDLAESQEKALATVKAKRNAVANLVAAAMMPFMPETWAEVQGALAEGVSINALHHVVGWSALMVAAKESDEEMVRALLGVEGINPNLKDKDGASALMHAARKGREKAMRALIPASDTGATDSEGRTALMIAAEGGHEKCVEALLAVCDPRARDKRGRDALMLAIIMDQPHLIKTLAERCDVLALDNQGRDAVAYAKAALAGNEHWLGQTLENLRLAHAKQEAAALKEAAQPLLRGGQEAQGGAGRGEPGENKASPTSPRL
jgi:hypothetical protein